MRGWRPRVVLLVGILLAGCASVGAPLVGERGIAVTGSGRVSLPPDTAVLDAGVEARGPQLADATAEVDRLMRAVLARVKAAGVRDTDVRTTTYAIEPIAEPRQPADTGVRIAGYQVSNVVQVRTRDVADWAGSSTRPLPPAPTSYATCTSRSTTPPAPKPRPERWP
jgi:hypothetical protein